MRRIKQAGNQGPVLRTFLCHVDKINDTSRVKIPKNVLEMELQFQIAQRIARVFLISIHICGDKSCCLRFTAGGLAYI